MPTRGHHESVHLGGEHYELDPPCARRSQLHSQRDKLREIVSPLSHGPIFKRQDGAAYVSPGSSGLSQLISRHVTVSDQKWDRYMERRRAGKTQPSRWSLYFIPILHPESWSARSWMGFMLLVDLVYTAFIVPVNVAFCTNTYGSSFTSGCTLVDFIGGVVYLVNMFFMVQVGFFLIKEDVKVPVLDRADVAYYYIFSSKFVVDCCSVVPFVYLIVVLATGPEDDETAPNSWIHLLSIIRMLRMARMLSISKLVTLDTASGQYKRLPLIGPILSVPVMYTALIAYFIMVLVNLQACILVLQAYLQPVGTQVFWDSITWIDTWTEPKAYQWYMAVYWVITTATGTGFGDVSPKNIVEQVLANINMIIGVLMFGLLVGTVANGLTRASAAAHKLYTHRKKVAEVEQWLQDRHLSKDVCEEIQAYFIQFWRGKIVSSPENSILSDLPSHLRDCALSAITGPLVAQVHGFQLLPPQLQSLIAGSLKSVTLLPGHDICVQGHDADRLWICESGGVIVLHFAEPGRVTKAATKRIRRGISMTSLHKQDSAASEGALSGNQDEAEVALQLSDAAIDTKYSDDFVPLCTPCLIGESVMLADDIPTCRQRLVTYRAIAPCVAWELKVQDLWPLMKLYPQIKVTMLEYLRNRLCRDIVGADVDPDNHYCELSDVIAKALNGPGVDPQKVDNLTMDLQRADIESGELGSVLDTLAEVCCVQPWARPAVTEGDVLGGTPLTTRSAVPATHDFPAASHYNLGSRVSMGIYGSGGRRQQQADYPTAPPGQATGGDGGSLRNGTALGPAGPVDIRRKSTSASQWSDGNASGGGGGVGVAWPGVAAAAAAVREGAAAVAQQQGNGSAWPIQPLTTQPHAPPIAVQHSQSMGSQPSQPLSGPHSQPATPNHSGPLQQLQQPPPVWGRSSTFQGQRSEYPPGPEATRSASGDWLPPLRSEEPPALGARRSAGQQQQQPPTQGEALTSSTSGGPSGAGWVGGGAGSSMQGGGSSSSSVVGSGPSLTARSPSRFAKASVVFEDDAEGQGSDGLELDTISSSGVREPDAEQSTLSTQEPAEGGGEGEEAGGGDGSGEGEPLVTSSMPPDPSMAQPVPPGFTFQTATSASAPVLTATAAATAPTQRPASPARRVQFQLGVPCRETEVLQALRAGHGGSDGPPPAASAGSNRGVYGSSPPTGPTSANNSYDAAVAAALRSYEGAAAAAAVTGAGMPAVAETGVSGGAPPPPMTRSAGSTGTRNVCTVCGHALCVTCGSVVGHPAGAAPGAPSAASELLLRTQAVIPGGRVGLARTPSLTRAAGSAVSAPTPAASQRGSGVGGSVGAEERPSGAALSRVLLRGPGGRQQGDTTWRHRLVGGGLNRSSMRLGTTSIDRYNSLGASSIPLQPDWTGPQR